jgi:hypothetical protein
MISSRNGRGVADGGGGVKNGLGFDQCFIFQSGIGSIMCNQLFAISI